MAGVSDIVITGIGCVTPIGIGREAFTQGLLRRRSAVHLLHRGSDPAGTCFFGARVPDFDPRQFVTPRKALKVMGREIQLAFSAAHLAWRDAGLTTAELDPDRLGVVCGAEIMPGGIEDLTDAIRACRGDDGFDARAWGTRFGKHIYPLWMLKYLPNMPACHMGLAIDARGPNNTIVQDEASGLLALAEAADIIARERADLMVVGGVATRVSATRLMYRAPELFDQRPSAGDDPGQPSVPFDRRRRGISPSEGAAAIVIESRRHAARRGAPILGVLRGYDRGFAPPARPLMGSGEALARAARAALERAAVDTDDLAHVSAQGFANPHLDIQEAQAIAEVAPKVPVTAFSSYFGTAGAASGLMELVASLIATRAGQIPPILGFEQPDESCPIRVCATEATTERDCVLKLSFTPMGHAVAAVVQCST